MGVGWGGLTSRVGKCPGAQPDTERATSISERSLPGLVSLSQTCQQGGPAGRLSDHLFLTFKAKGRNGSRKDRMSCLFGS